MLKPFAALLVGTVSATYFYSCNEVAFCQRYRTFQEQQLSETFKKHKGIPPMTASNTKQQYNAEMNSFQIFDTFDMHFNLTLQNQTSPTI
jgi:hypothetical protein